MKKKVRKDNNLRKKYLLEEAYKFIFSYSSNNVLFNNSIRDHLYKKRLHVETSHFNQHIRRCVNTGRKKRVNKWFNFSRLALSRYIRTKKILHWKKSKW